MEREKRKERGVEGKSGELRNGWIDGWMDDGWMDGWLNGWVDGGWGWMAVMNEKEEINIKKKVERVSKGGGRGTKDEKGKRVVFVHGLGWVGLGWTPRAPNSYAITLSPRQ